MCGELHATKDKIPKAQIEWSVGWNPHFEISDDLRNAKPVLIEEPAYEYLKEAATITADLVKNPPKEEVPVKGHVVGLYREHHINEWEMGTITVEDEYTKKRVQIFLPPKEYMQAGEAHLGRKQVAAKGVLRRIGERTRLMLISQFEVLEPEQKPASLFSE